MNLSIIIVNYKTPQLVIDCISSFYQKNQHIQSEVLVIDNASDDNSEDLITRAHPSVRWIQMHYNSGFARANNMGIQQAKADIILLLNSDTLDHHNAIENCYIAFSKSEYIACGVQLLNKDGSPQISGNFVMRGGLNYLLPLPYLGSFIRWLGYTLKVKKTNIPDAKNTVEVDWINGAFLMVKKEAINKAGLLDEDFFLYAEEAEWCSRLKKAGKLCIFGQYNIVHLQGESANATFGSSGLGYYNLTDKKGLQIMVSNFVRIRKQFGIQWFLLHLFLYTLTVPLWLVLSFIHHLIRLENPFSAYREIFRFSGNLLKLWQLSPVIIRNKPFFYKLL
ncbi:MAG: glycosyltransferase family 2 protein [Chitinophagaceae bacterium]|nr:glycosyltransferase family 2 protein [Chitinophagaceae bacterium]